MQLFDNVAKSMQQAAGKGGGAASMDVRTMGLLAALLLGITAPLDLSQLAFALVGALAYALIHFLQVSTARINPKHVKDFPPCVPPSPPLEPLTTRSGAGHRGRFGSLQATTARKPTSTSAIHAAASGPEFRKASTQPVAKPTFKAAGWDAEVQELVATISPSSESKKIVAQMARVVERRLSAAIPGIEVTAFITSDLHRGTAFGVAVPEVDLVASICPDVFLRGCVTKDACDALNDPKKLQKAAIRFCTNMLVGGCGFKFRRSAFKSSEPKVTLLASEAVCGSAQAIPVDFSVNSTVPLFNAALVTECGQIEPRAHSLILMVRRWAKDRGVCHAAKGHLPPYAWTLLVMYFLQTGSSPALLPPLARFKCSSGLVKGSSQSGEEHEWKAPEESDPKTVGQLFKEFVAFYVAEFKFRKEAVSVRRGKRAPPELTLPIHVVLGYGLSGTQVAPSIEDPFEPTRNLSESSTAFTVGRLHEELARAQDICTRGGPLSELLEPWVPAWRPEDEEPDH